MHNHITTHWRLPVALTALAALTACGGSDPKPEPTPPRVERVVVVGDSLNDSGTFAGLPGFPRTFTVQGTADEPDVVWVERIAASYELAPLCPIYKFNGETFTPNSQPNCTNYAIGGARINWDNTASPESIIKQLHDAGTRSWSDKDLVLMDGGGNDAADLVAAYLSLTDGWGTSYYEQFIRRLLPDAVVTGVANSPDRYAVLGVMYMEALADQFTSAIRSYALDKGATQVVVANIPTITYTPRFQAVLAQIEGAAGAAARAQAEGLFKGWINAFNQKLAANFNGEARVQVVDVATRFADQVTNPAKYGLSNASLPVCGAEWIPASVVPHRELADCTASALSTTPPAPGSPSGTNWWQRFMFSDSFHPSPYGHQLFADQVIEQLDAAGWR